MRLLKFEYPPVALRGLKGGDFPTSDVQGYLAHKKNAHPPRTPPGP